MKVTLLKCALLGCWMNMGLMLFTQANTPNDNEAFQRLSEWMTGSFSNEFQSNQDTSYYHISLEMHPIWQDRTDAIWLYVEQALFTQKDKPYRQRVYQLLDKGNGEFESVIYKLPEEEKYINQGPEAFNDLNPESLEIREGCAVFLKDRGDFFMGATNEKDCKSTLRGAAYATSQVRVFEDRLISWDQGFNEADKQMWGAEKGGYIFDKIIPMQYPNVRRDDVVDDYFGTEVADPYRWLEDESHPDTKEWIKTQNELTFDYLSEIPFKNRIKERLEELMDYPRYSSPYKEGEYYYFFKNDGLQEQSAMYRQKGLDGTAELFLDPNDFSEDGTISLSGWSFSKDGKYFSYGVSRGGSDWKEVRVMEVANKRMLRDHLKNIKFSTPSWYKDGFYYSRFEQPKEGETYSEKNTHQKIYYHKVGDDQSQDILIYEDPEHPTRNGNIYVTTDEKYAFLSIWEGTHNNTLYFAKADIVPKGFCPIADAVTSGFKPIADEMDGNYWIVDNIDDQFLLMTDYKAPNYRLVQVNPKKTKRKKWKDIIPESKHVLESVSHHGGKLIAKYAEDVQSKLYVYSTSGKKENTIELPGPGTVGGLFGKKDENITFFGFTSFTVPTNIYQYNIETQELSLFKASEMSADLEQFETKQIFYKSKDGTKVPMFITYKKGLELNGNNPTYLYGYGGFNISIDPQFSSQLLVFLENGGVYASANLRGGSEYGEKWHQDGMLDNKQNVFDDFISAAEYLIAEKYTSSDKLAIAGRSNGGLLVGAVMTQRPELFKVALPTVGVLDMLRYHKFTIGWAWAVEYGSSENEAQFKTLYQYSPLHNIKKGTQYPATLVLTADRDDRVVPAHSFKFISELQAAQAGNAPCIIRVDVKAGHGAGKSMSQFIDERADIWAFVFNHLGMTFQD